jgi:hypothetical protein
MTNDKYLALITSEHEDKLKFGKVVGVSCLPLSTQQDVLLSIPSAFDVDTAVGAQLDIIGLWVGADRRLSTPITGVFFSWGDSTVGWADGVWRDPSQAAGVLTDLFDEDYRTLIRAKIAANHWDGSINKAISIWQTAFGNDSFLIIIDHQDMSMGIGLSGRPVTTVERAMLINKIIPIIKPAGVRISEIFALPSAGAAMAWGATPSAAVAGWGVGQWPYYLPI